MKFQINEFETFELDVNRDETIEFLIKKILLYEINRGLDENMNPEIMLLYKNTVLDNEKCINHYNIGPDDFVLVINNYNEPRSEQIFLQGFNLFISRNRRAKEETLSLLRCISTDYVTIEFPCSPDNIIDDLLNFLSEKIDIPHSNIKLFKDKNTKHLISNDRDFNKLLNLIKKRQKIDIYFKIVADVDNLVKQRRIGRGAFGCVYKCIEIGSKNEFALKELCVAQHNCNSYEALKSEIDILNQIGDHPRIIRMIKKIESEDSLCILMEYASGGSVGQLLRKEGSLEENKISKFSFQILEALEYLHEKEILHRDIKGDNILIFQDESVKLCDFGLSKILTDIASANLLNGVHQSTAGTVNWMAPEVINGEEYGFSADIWSFGATVVEMLTGKPPYHGLPLLLIINKIRNSRKIEFKERGCNPHTKSFLNFCLHPNPFDRPKASDLLKHEFIQISKPIFNSNCFF